MDIFELFKENKIESTIVSGNRNEIIYQEVYKNLPSLLKLNEEYESESLESQKSNNFEKLRIASHLMRRKGMQSYLEALYRKDIKKVDNFLFKTMEIVDKIDDNLSVLLKEENGSKVVKILCENSEIVQFNYMSIFEIVKNITEIKNNSSPDLFFNYIRYFEHENSDRIVLFWFFHLLKKEDFLKIKEIQKKSGRISLDVAVDKMFDSYLKSIKK